MAFWFYRLDLLRAEEKSVGVFISYSHIDESIAKAIKAKCERRGVRPCFLAAKDMAAGDRIVDRIDEELRKCHTLLILITGNSKSSSWVAFEAGAAAALSKNLVPLLCEGDVEYMPDVLKRWHAKPLTELDDVISQIKERLNTFPQISGEYRYKFEGQNKPFTYQGCCTIEQGDGNRLVFHGRRKQESRGQGNLLKRVNKEWHTEHAYLWDDLTINAEYRLEGAFNGYFRLHVDQYDSKGRSQELNGYAYMVSKQLEYGPINFEKLPT